MATPKPIANIGLHELTMIDFVATKGDKVSVRQMTIKDSKAVVKVQGWKYQAYQIGSHGFIDNVKK